MSDLSIFKNPAAYHIIAYGTLLGSSVYQSFVAGIVGFRALPRPNFSQLQEKITPVFFGIQTVLPVILALTYPGCRTPFGAPSSIQDAFSNVNRWSVTLGTMFLSGFVNLLYLGPQTTHIMKVRKHQETRDGKKSYDAGPHSTEMQKLNTAFGWMHSASALVNLGGLIATVWYGFLLAERIH